MAKILETNRDTLARQFSDDLDYFCKFILRGFLRKIRLSFLSERNQRMMKPSKTWSIITKYSITTAYLWMILAYLGNFPLVLYLSKIPVATMKDKSKYRANPVPNLCNAPASLPKFWAKWREISKKANRFPKTWIFRIIFDFCGLLRFRIYWSGVATAMKIVATMPSQCMKR